MPKFYTLAGNPPQLAGRDLAAISKEEWGPLAKRPWVHMADSHEALEKALWCYERGMVPVVTERDPALAAAMGQRYDADLLITDSESLRALVPHLQGLPSVRTVVVFGAHSAELERLLADKEVRFIEG